MENNKEMERAISECVIAETQISKRLNVLEATIKELVEMHKAMVRDYLDFKKAVVKIDSDVADLIADKHEVIIT